jgi:hypothetical protein
LPRAWWLVLPYSAGLQSTNHCSRRSGCDSPFHPWRPVGRLKRVQYAARPVSRLRPLSPPPLTIRSAYYKKWAGSIASKVPSFLGAAVIDGILAMLLLGVVTGFQDSDVDAVNLLLVLVQAIGFIMLIGVSGMRIMRRASNALERRSICFPL